MRFLCVWDTKTRLRISSFQAGWINKCLLLTNSPSSVYWSRKHCCFASKFREVLPTVRFRSTPVDPKLRPAAGFLMFQNCRKGILWLPCRKFIVFCPHDFRTSGSSKQIGRLALGIRMDGAKVCAREKIISTNNKCLRGERCVSLVPSSVKCISRAFCFRNFRL